ncbi:MAG: glycosyltransferase family 39 protein [Pelobacteraceae bacterium]
MWELNNKSGAENNSTPLVAERRLHYFLLFIYLVVVFRLWIMPLGSSLWLDETVTYWNVMYGPLKSLARSTEIAGQFHLYMLIESMSVKLFGLNEIALRLPSVVASCLSSCLIYRLAKRFSSGETGMFAAIMFVCMPEICLESSNARPYALTILCSLCAISQLIKLHDSFRWRYVVGYVMAATLMVYMHHISAPFLFVFVMYSLIFTNGSLDHLRIYIIHISVFVLLIPLVYLVVFTGKNTSILSFAGTPGIYTLIRTIVTDLVLVILLCYYASKISLKNEVKGLLPFYNKQIDAFLCLWFICPVLLFYAISLATDYKLFYPRYMILAYPALVLLLAAILQKNRLVLSRYATLIIVCAFSIITIGGKERYPSLHNEDWRGALSAAKGIAVTSNIPILFNSGYLVTFQQEWKSQTSDDWELSPLSAYQVKTRVIPLPLRLTPNAGDYLETNVLKQILSEQSFVVVHRGQSSSVDSWVNDHVRDRGYERLKQGYFAGVSVILYKKHRDLLAVPGRTSPYL